MFYGWRVVAGTFLAQFFVVGFFTYAASLLVAPVRADFGGSLEQVMYGFAFGTLLGLGVSPVAGIMLDRYPVRWLITGGALSLAVGMWWLAHSRTIIEYSLVFGLTMALANAYASSMAGSTVIARWFTASRGRALGVASIGTSVGGIALPWLLAAGIEAHGWRHALQLFAGGTLLLLVPAVALLVRGRPADVGLEPEPGSSAVHAQDQGRLLTTGVILAHPGFWFLSLSLGLLFCAYSAMLANLGPYAMDRGYDEAVASTLIMVVAVSGLVGKLLFGMLADRVNLKLGLGAAQLLVLVAFGLLAAEPAYGVILAASGCIGLAAGGMLPVWGAMMPRIFGLLSYGRAMGLMGPVITLCVLPGFAVVGRLYDASGSYTQALQLFCAVMVLALLLLLPLRLEQPASTAA